MLQTLVECRSNEDTSIQWTPRMTLVHGFIPMALISHGMQTFTNVIHLDIGEWSGISLAALEHGNLSKNTFNQLCNGHSRRNGMRVDNDIRHNTLARERHILLTVTHSNRTLLTMPRCKLVSHLGNTDVTDANLRETVPLLRRADENIVDDSIFIGLHGGTAISLGVTRGGVGHLVGGGRLSDEDVVSGDTGAGRGQAIVVEFAVISVLHSSAGLHVGTLEQLRV
mmetsp:Transcript_10927/g.19942  ORF Transcript_10927/g.19942 Transcript_10927/m.19942 type:complete len:225 (-) Transcript_10927:2758-3432(-)